MQKLEEQSSSFFVRLKDFVKKWEWNFQANAFCDDYYRTDNWLFRKSPDECWYWSIWFWTKSYRWEVITLEEAIERKTRDLEKRNSLITSTCLTDNQRIAIVDFMYQHWVYSGIKEYANKCEINKAYNLIVWWRDNYKSKNQTGMVKREQLRINLFYK